MSSGKSSGGSQTASNAPWSVQQPYLQTGYQNAQSVYDQRTAQGAYGGEYYAPNSTGQNNAVSQAGNWTNGQGGALSGTTANTSTALQGAANPYLNNATNIAQNGAGTAGGLTGVLNGYATGQTPASQTNGQLSGALNSAAINGAGTLSNFANGQTQVMNQSLADPTAQLTASAQQYMNSAPVQGAINSTNAQINQQLNESTVPQLNRSAAMGGSLNSSRAGMAESMANENAAIATGNADSQIQNNAFNTGLTTAAAERNAGLTTGMYAANSGLVDNAGLAQGQQNYQQGASQFGTSTALNAASTGLNYNLGNTNAQLSANSQLGNATNMGINGATQAGQQAGQNYNLASAAGGLQQSGQQALDNNAYAQYQGQNTYQQGVLNSYMGAIGSPTGSQSSSQTQLPPNYAGSALGGAAAGAGLYNMYNSGSSNNNANYNPANYGYNGDINSSGGQALQGMGFVNPLTPNW
jgi:hypothetical protein